MGVIFFLTLIFSGLTLYVTRHADKSGVGFFKVLNIFYIIALVILFIVSFFYVGSYSTSKIITKWSALSSYDRLNYDNNVNNLLTRNKSNLLLHAIYNIGLTILFVLQTIFLFIYDHRLPEVWIREGESRVTMQKGNKFLS